MAGGPVPTREKTWAGAEQRRQPLGAAGIRVSDELGLAGKMAAVDDVLDAAAAAWTARRYASGQARSIPTKPQVFSDGLRCAIWA
jgi:predicted RNase H-like nuclease